MAKTHHTGRFARDTIVVLVITCLLAIGLELALRFFVPQDAFVTNVDQSWVGHEMADPDPVLGYRLKPGKQTAEYEINSLGYRGREFQQEKKKGTYRIICIGGSTTIGSNAGNNRYTYPSLLEKMLRDVFKGCSLDVEVINAGVFGYHSWHSLARFPSEIEALQPDLVIAMDGLNDVVAAYSLSFTELISNGSRREKFMSSLINKQGEKQGGWLYNLSQLRSAQAAAWVMNGVNHVVPLSFFIMRWKMKFFGFETNLSRMISEAKTKNIPVLLVNYPWISREWASLEQEKARNPYGFQDGNMYRLYQFGRTFVKQVNEAVSSKLSVPLADPQPVVDAHTGDNTELKTVYSDNMHFTRYGNMLLAKVVMDAVVTTEPFKSKVASCQTFHKAYSHYDLEKAYPDIFRWRVCLKNGDTGAPCLAEAYPKMQNVKLENVKISRAEGEWCFFTPEDASKPGEVTFSLASTEFPWSEASVFPRLNRKSESISLVVSGDGPELKSLIFSIKDETDVWTPMLVPIFVDLPATQGQWNFKVVLKGQDAQLWTHNYAVVFHGSLN